MHEHQSLVSENRYYRLHINKGNLVIYKKGQCNDKFKIWDTETDCGAALSLHDDGNVCLKDHHDNVIWSSDVYMDADKLDR